MTKRTLLEKKLGY